MILFACFAILVAFLTPCASAQAPVITNLLTLCSFTGTNGAGPRGLMKGSDEGFYGTTSGGGSSSKGTVFRITPNGVLTTLCSFSGTNGATPYGGLVQGTDGNFYGTTYWGGVNGYGTVFRITPSGVLTTLYSFTQSDGNYPAGGLVQGNDGNFYGTTYMGGANGYGTVFRITPNGILTTLWSFNYWVNGASPWASLMLGSDGNFYGTTTSGGTWNGSSGLGTAFRITQGGVLTPLCSFSSANASPYASLTLGSDGNFYGTTQSGGSNFDGTVFRMTPNGSLTTICSFNYSNGAYPGGLLQGSDGNVYGTTQAGGSHSQGTVFEITSSGEISTLYNFSGSDGQAPIAALVQGSSSNFFGTASSGGASGYGTVFELAPSLVTTGTIRGFNYQVLASNNPTSYNAMGLPEGLSIDASTGLISGTPVVTGTFSVSVSATNPEGTGSSTLTIVVPPTPVVTSALSVTGTNAAAFTYQIAATTNPISYGASGLPPGLSVNTATGLISGTPTATGTFTVPINVTNVFGTTNATLAITVVQMPAPVITSALSATGTDGLPFGYQIAATTNPVTYGANNLPPGLNINAATGLISGMPAVSGTFDVPVSATNAGGTGSATLTITVLLPPPPAIINLLTLCSFSGTNGATPYGGLIQGPDGNLYGTTYAGGSSNNGTVFRITPGGVLTTLASFNKTNGRCPFGELAQGTDGNFYGTTSLGGSSDSGTVFRITPSGVLTTLCSFTTDNGAAPEAGLIMGSDGNFYGTTNGGGSHVYRGTVFRITPSGALTTLYSFDYTTSGENPYCKLAQGNDGNFYGTTSWMNNGEGTVFQITPGGVLTTLFIFNGTNGSFPEAGLTQGKNGSFYGTTSGGGSSGNGTVFRITPSGVLTTLSLLSGTNGSDPVSGLLQGSDGNFYGTTQFGGSNNAGTLFSITPSGSLTTLYSFSGTDGQNPYAGLTQASNGNYYGTTSSGGSGSSGTVFEFAPSVVTTGTTNGFSYQVLAANNPASYTAKGLPRGLSINSSTGQISGTSSEIGTFSVSLSATNPGGTGISTLTIIVPGTPVITSALSVTGTNATAFSYQIAATGTPTSYGASGLPPGLSVNAATGTINGTPTVPGTFNVSINAANAFESTSATVTITVKQMPAPVITSALNAAGNNGFSFYYRITASGNPTSYGASGLPAGLSINTATGLISGTAAAVGTSNVTITASNLGGTASKTLAITMAKNTAPRITLPYKLITLCSFSGTNGNGSYGGLVQGNDGDFYGTTTGGGYNNSGVGTAFRVTPDGTLTTLHSFQASDGANPNAGLIKGSDGNFYGTTKWGGNASYGTAFQITPSGTVTTLGSFSYSANGSNPYGGLVQGNDGNFYGTTEYGLGVNGTVFKVTPDGNLTTLASFTYDNGSNPYAGMLLGSDGNFYGTTTLSSMSRGTVFKITAGGSLTTIYSFALTGADGGSPEGGLIQGSDGNFYGTTWWGGSGGGGTVFKLTSSGSLTTLHGFTGTDGKNPYAALAQGQDGNFYGTTVGGGNGYGTVFQVTPDGTLTTLYSFSGTDGALPYGGLLQGTDGNFYGTTCGEGDQYGTYSGGFAYGTVFEIGQGLFVTGTNNSSNYQIVATNTPSSYTATGLPPGLGVNTATGLISGTATVTGTFSVPISATNGDGTGSATMTIVVMPSPVITSATTMTVTRDEAFSYQIEATNHATSYAASGLPDGLYMDEAGLISGWPTVTGTFSVQISAFNAGSAGTSTLVITVIPPPPTITNLLTLCTFETTNHNATSLYGGLVQGRDGNFYGTIDGTDSGKGAVFRLTPEGVWTTLYSFSGTDGANPYAGLVQGTDGNYYGTTYFGGNNGDGTVFAITPSGNLTTLYSFNGTDGANPQAGLVQGSDGNFYGTTYSGGGSSGGTVFAITPSGNLTTLYSFSGPDGANPYDGLVQGTDGNYYGTTFSGGSNGDGTVFTITSSGNLTTLYSFNGTDGSNPKGGLIQGKNGNFYGTTTSGGSAGYGTVFRITASGVLTTLHSFTWGDGADPYASLVEGSDGNFYGTTNDGGPYSAYYGWGGTVFQMTPGGTETTLCNFSESGGSAPTSPLIQGCNGNYYGTTSRSGSYIISTAFELAPSAVTTGTTNRFNYQILATNSPTNYTASRLPTGLNLDTATGLISGTPTVTGTFSVPLTATNAGGSGSGTITIVVLPPPTITPSSSTVTGTCGAAWNFQIQASGSPSCYDATGLPLGLNVNMATGLISGTPMETGTFNATISATNVSGTSCAGLTIGVQASYAAWKNQVFTPTQLSDSTISGDTASPAGDGIPNLMKYALNLNPMITTKLGSPVLGTMVEFFNNRYSTLTYSRPITAYDITYTVEVSEDLQTWLSGSDQTSVVSVTNLPDALTQTVVVKDLTRINGTNRRFIRLKVTRP